jgi:glycerophosphoryl diester phosphodiesterase
MVPVGTIFLALATAAGQMAPCLLPAYAHNDYENETPLSDAIELGYRGVEADFYLLDGELLVAHDQGDVVSGRSLESLYLAPLRERIERLGSVHGDGSQFYLNIEAKEDGPESYQALRNQLSRYEDILTTVRAGELKEGAVSVILVGWYPPLDELAREDVRYVSVQRQFQELQASDAGLPTHLLRLISVEYRRLFRWGGRGRMPRRFSRGLSQIRAIKSAHPGCMIRVLRAPRSAPVYEALLRAGVDLIGAKDIVRTREELLKVVGECE